MKTKNTAARGIIGKIFQYAVILIVLAVSLYPIIWVFISSFKASPGGLGLPEKWIFDGYVTIFTKLNIMSYFGNSLFVAATSTILSVIVVTMSAYVCARMKFRFKGLITFMFASTLFIPQYAISFPIYRMMNAMHLYNTRIGLIFVYTGLNIAISFFIIRSYFAGLPKEMEEAAQIDGCSHTATFLHIMLPLAKPGISTGVVLAFLNNWNEFYFASLLLQSREKMTIPALLGQFTTAYALDLNGMFSAIIVAIIPTIILFCCSSELFVKSLTDGAVKG